MPSLLCPCRFSEFLKFLHQIIFENLQIFSLPNLKLRISKSSPWCRWLDGGATTTLRWILAVMNSDQVDWKELDLKGSMDSISEGWDSISGSIEDCDGLSGSIEDWCDADTMALGFILFMYELPVGRRQNQRICRFLFVFRKAPVLEFSHGICSKRAEYQY